MSDNAITYSEQQRQLVNLIDDLMAPQFSFRMARANHRPGSNTRAINALTSMQEIVDDYVNRRYVQLHPRVQTNDYDPY